MVITFFFWLKFKTTKVGHQLSTKLQSGRFWNFSAKKSARNFCQIPKVAFLWLFDCTPLIFFDGWPWKKILFFLFKVSTYLFGMSINFSHSALPKAIFSKKVPTVWSKKAFFSKNNTLSFRNDKKYFFTKFGETMYYLSHFTVLD